MFTYYTYISLISIYYCVSFYMDYFLCHVIYTLKIKVGIIDSSQDESFNLAIYLWILVFLKGVGGGATIDIQIRTCNLEIFIFLPVDYTRLFFRMILYIPSSGKSFQFYKDTYIGYPRCKIILVEFTFCVCHNLYRLIKTEICIKYLLLIL